MISKDIFATVKKAVANTGCALVPSGEGILAVWPEEACKNGAQCCTLILSPNEENHDQLLMCLEVMVEGVLSKEPRPIFANEDLLKVVQDGIRRCFRMYLKFFPTVQPNDIGPSLVYGAPVACESKEDRGVSTEAIEPFVCLLPIAAANPYEPPINMSAEPPGDYYGQIYVVRAVNSKTGKSKWLSRSKSGGDYSLKSGPTDTTCLFVCKQVANEIAFSQQKQQPEGREEILYAAQALSDAQSQWENMMASSALQPTPWSA